MSPCIAASIPGRLRLRDAALRNPQRNAALCLALRAGPGVRRVEGRPQAASVLVFYGVQTTANAMADWAAGVASGFVARASSPCASPTREARGTPRVRANRVAKRGMLGSLAASLLFAAVGGKRWHALAGGHFLLFLAVHLWVHRRHLLR